MGHRRSESPQTAARGSDRDDLAGLSIRMFFPQLHTSHGDFRAAGQIGVDDPLTIIDTVPADRCDLRRCGTGLGQPYDTRPTKVAALSMTLGKLLPDFFFRETFPKKLPRFC